jgi:hypothetical protein
MADEMQPIDPAAQTAPMVLVALVQFNELWKHGEETTTWNALTSPGVTERRDLQSRYVH